MSEDCLTINVRRPAKLPSGAKLPVMVFIYGGSFVTGSASRFDGQGIVARSAQRGTPVIFVNFNYRLGPLGFPQGRDAANKGTLNLGLKDQIAALKWVQANIEFFGGDKSKVTVFGESAGAISIGLLYLNSGLQSLARAAIFESGSAGSTPIFAPERNQGSFDKFVNAASSKCLTGDNLACLKGVSSVEIVQGMAAIAKDTPSWFPALDGNDGLIPDLPSKMWATGRFARMSFMAGTNLYQGTVLTPQRITTSEQTVQMLTGLCAPSKEGTGVVGAAVSQTLELYSKDPAKGSPFGTGDNLFGTSAEYKRAAAISGDVLFQAQRRAWMQAATKAGIATYGYYFTDPRAVAPLVVVKVSAPGSLGVSHVSEVPFVFGAPQKDPVADKLSKRMIDYWVSFANTLNPNDGKGNDRPVWPFYTNDRKMLLELIGACCMSTPISFSR